MGATTESIMFFGHKHGVLTNWTTIKWQNGNGKMENLTIIQHTHIAQFFEPVSGCMIEVKVFAWCSRVTKTIHMHFCHNSVLIWHCNVLTRGYTKRNSTPKNTIFTYFLAFRVNLHLKAMMSTQGNL